MNRHTIQRAGTALLALSFLLAPFAPVASTGAQAAGYPWKDHARPFDFRFGNNIDTHQQTQVKSSGDLFGFLYITYTGEEIDGIPVAEHCDGSTPADLCEVGWIIRGRYLGGAAAPTFVYQANDHPTWLVESRNDIPQPGSFSHFHWLGDPPGGGGLIQGERRDGYLLQLDAVDQFYFRHFGEELLVTPGTDIATHVNIVGSFPLFP